MDRPLKIERNEFDGRAGTFIYLPDGIVKAIYDDGGVDFLRLEQETVQKEAEWNEALHPRDEHGRFTDSAAGTPPNRSTQDWIDGMAANPDAVKKQWRAMTAAQKARVADPVNSIPVKMKELLEEKPWPATTTERIKQYEPEMGTKASALHVQLLSSLEGRLKEAGIPQSVADDFLRKSTDHLIAQEIEGQSRALGDHGAHHLSGNAEMAKSILAVLPGGLDTPQNRLMMDVAAVYHDAGYLTPPAGVLLQKEHPDWSAIYFAKLVGPDLEPHMGAAWVKETTRAIGMHSKADIDWENDPLRSAFGLADNLALFHKEKMPPLLRMVNGANSTLVALGKGDISEDVAKGRLQRHIENQADLTPGQKRRLTEAAQSVSKWFPRNMLGMLGAKLDSKPKWDVDHLEIGVIRTPANKSLSRVIDGGQQQFRKLVETYGLNADDFLKQKEARFVNKNGRLAMTIKMRDSSQKEDLFSWLLG